MKNIHALLLAALFWLGVHTVAQGQYYRDATESQTVETAPRLFLRPSLGINNPVGFLGVQLEAGVSSQGGVRLGGGISTWGFKFDAGGRYYFSEFGKGWSLGGGATLNTGFTEIEFTELNTINGPADVTMRLLPVFSLYGSAMHQWRVGKFSTFSVEISYTARTQTRPYRILSNHVLTNDSEQLMGFLQPGGVGLNLGFSFPLDR